MQYLVLLIPLLGVLEALLTFQNLHFLESYIQIELVILALCGCFTIRKSLWIFLTVFYFWVFVSDLLFSFSTYYVVTEVVVSAMIIYWLCKRPEKIPSDPPSDTVQFAFRYGKKSPLIAKIASFIGLRVTSIAIIIGDEVILPNQGKLEKHSRSILKNWIKLDTGVVVIENIKKEFKALENKEFAYAHCMLVLRQFMYLLGAGYGATSNPSSYMSKLLDKG